MSKGRRVYRLYDQLLESDVPLALPSVAPAEFSNSSKPIWRLEEGAVAKPTGDLVHDVLDFDGQRRLQVWQHPKRGILFAYGKARILWDNVHRKIVMERGDLRARPAIALERMAAPIAFLLQRSRMIALHASAVVDNEGRAWIFAGRSGAGKSTTALELHRRGFDLLADDLVLVDVDRQVVMAATPSVRLFDPPEAVPEAIDGELVMPGIDKYWYRLSADAARAVETPMAAIFSLAPDPAVAAPAVETLRGQEAIVAVLAQAFDLTDAPGHWRAQRFRALCDMARAIPIGRATYAHGDRQQPVQVELLTQAIAELRSRGTNG